MAANFEADLAAIDRIRAVPTILEVVCRTTGMGFAAVARVTQDRWIACAVKDDIAFGLQPGGELKVETTICREVRNAGEPVIIDHVADDAVYCGHPTPAMYGFQSYISMPIRLPDGSFFGTLCAIDPRPARLKNPETIGMFKLFAELIGFHLDASDRLAASEASLLDERSASELREQFIAVLGHDLRNPLASIDAGAKMLLKEALSPRGATVVGLVQSSVGRMSELIDNVLDFARGRLGGGLLLSRDAQPALGPALEQVVEELRAAWPDRTIETRFSIARPVSCDRARIAQLLEPRRQRPDARRARRAGHGVRVDRRQRLFPVGGEQGRAAAAGDPGATVPAVLPRRGASLAREIAAAHGGTLAAASSANETRFTFRMPV